MVWSVGAFCKTGIVSKYYRADAKASRSAGPIAQGGFPPWAEFLYSSIKVIKSIERPPIFEDFLTPKMGYFILSVELRFLKTYG
jgi:hypothetical protein